MGGIIDFGCGDQPGRLGRLIRLALLVALGSTVAEGADQRPIRCGNETTAVAVADDETTPVDAGEQSAIQATAAADGHPGKPSGLTLLAPANFADSAVTPPVPKPATPAHPPLRGVAPRHSIIRWKEGRQPERLKTAKPTIHKPSTSSRRPAFAWKQRQDRATVRTAASWPIEGQDAPRAQSNLSDKPPAKPSQPNQLQDPYVDPFGDREAAVGNRRRAPAVLPQRASHQTQAPTPTQQPMAFPRDLLQRYRIDCEKTNRRYGQNPITNIGLDITPLFGRGSDLAAMLNETEKELQLQNVSPRTWRGRDGQTLAVGKVTDFAQGHLIVQTAAGPTVRIPQTALALEDLAYFGALWGIPVECQIISTTPERSWLPATMTWRATSVGHKPLYFDEPQLERHGHTSGPVMQPIVSGAHFFLNLAMAPYKMGIHPPHECQYALGYERPGNASPWLLPPLPLSLRGAITAGGIYSGGVFVVP